MLCTSAEHRLNRSDPKRKGEVHQFVNIQAMISKNGGYGILGTKVSTEIMLDCD